jgi:CBS domain-containing protein
VSSIVGPDPATVFPETPIVDAIETMLTHRVGALPVVREGRLVGILSEHDLMRIARELLVLRLCIPRPAAVRHRAVKSPAKSASV